VGTSVWRQEKEVRWRPVGHGWCRCHRTGEGSGARAMQRDATGKRGQASQGPGVSGGCRRERGE
jgi:hypothetical protein